MRHNTLHIVGELATLALIDSVVVGEREYRLDIRYLIPLDVVPEVIAEEEELTLRVIYDVDYIIGIKEFNFGIRSMSRNSIIYPYWENVARATEDRLAVILVFQLLFTAIPVVLISAFIFKAWKGKKWTLKSILIHAKDKLDMEISKRKQQRKYDKQRKQREL